MGWYCLREYGEVIKYLIAICLGRLLFDETVDLSHRSLHINESLEH